MLHTSERPTSFEQMLGNKEIIKSLKAGFAKKTHPHCYMFSGLSGLGKSTIARICASILGAGELDIHEYNMADTRGIDTAREIIDKMVLAPLGKSTIIILDELHKATSGFQEAMLKPTEDVPSHVYFFLCTTAPNKIIATLKRRFTQYTVQPIDDTELFVYIVKVARKHNIKISKKVLEVLITQAHGSTAIALVLLEKISNVDETTQLLLLNDVESAEKDVRDLCVALLYKKSWSTIAKTLKSLQQDHESARYVVLAYMASVLLNPLSTQYHLRSAQIIDIFSNMFYTQAELVCACFSVYKI